MMNTNKIFIRIILMMSYVLLCAVLVFLISSIFSYLNTGADRSSLLKTQVKKESIYLPELTWKNDGNEGRFLSDQVRAEIEGDYLDSWYIKQLAYRNNNKKGIEDYYTQNARKNLYSIIEYNKKDSIYIEATTLSHNPDVLFYSEDGQFIVLDDKNVLQHQKIYRNDKQILETTELSDYKHIMLLEDGFWRIRHTVKETVKEFNENILSTQTDSIIVKGINYYPKDTPWNMFGDDFDIDIISNDFKIVKDANLNSVRIFIQYEDFGKANLKEDKLKKLKQVLDEANKQNIKAVVTLFDFYGNYDILDWTLTYKHAKGIVTRFKDHPAILAWDLKNEPNLDFKSRGKSNVISWLEHLMIMIKSIDKNHPITIGWSNIESASILSDKVDYVSFHYYEDLSKFEKAYLKLRSEIKDKPIILQEFGVSSYKGIWNPFGRSKDQQANYHKEIQQILEKNKIHFMSWTLYDFNEVPKSVVGSLPWRTIPQKKFGFISTDGKKKPVFKYISNKN